MRIMTMLLLCAATLPGQEKEKPKQDWTVKLFTIKYAEPGQLRNLLRLFGAQMDADNQLKILTVSAPHNVMPAIEDAVKRLDVPPPPVQNIEMTIYILAGTDQPAMSGLPAELEPVAKQLRATFGHKGYRLVDTQIIRTRPGQMAETSGVLDQSGAGGQKIISQFKVGRPTVTSDEKGRSIRLDGLRLGMKVPVQTKADQIQYLDVGINTDIDVREGQKVVVGKAASIEGDDKASFLVITARVAE